MAENADRSTSVSLSLEFDGKTIDVQGSGNGPIDAFVDALGMPIKLMDYHEHAISAGANAQAACYVELRVNNGPTCFGVGIDANIVTASFRAVLSAVNRQLTSSTGLNVDADTQSPRIAQDEAMQ
jgi:2-isopropylmalate synthase